MACLFRRSEAVAPFAECWIINLHTEQRQLTGTGPEYPSLPRVETTPIMDTVFRTCRMSSMAESRQIKSASSATGYVLFYELTGDRKYLDAAIPLCRRAGPSCSDRRFGSYSRGPSGSMRGPAVTLTHWKNMAAM